MELKEGCGENVRGRKRTSGHLATTTDSLMKEKKSLGPGALGGGGKLCRCTSGKLVASGVVVAVTSLLTVSMLLQVAVVQAAATDYSQNGRSVVILPRKPFEHPSAASAAASGAVLGRALDNRAEVSAKIGSALFADGKKEAANVASFGPVVRPPGSGDSSVSPGATDSPAASGSTSGVTESKVNAAVGARAQTTPYSGFWSGVVTSFSLTMITEFGDRTFFIAALMSMRYGKIWVLIGAVTALISQTIVSICIGRLLHLLPSSSTRAISAIPLDDYGAAVMLFIFGMLHLRAAFQSPGGSANGPPRLSQVAPASQPLSNNGIQSRQQQQQSQFEENCGDAGEEYFEAKEGVDRVQYMTLGSRPGAWAVMKETFWVVFVAEVGDKSMISTIALATAQNPFGVLLGGAAAHTTLTVAAILAGSMLGRYISNKVANVVGGILFLSYALLTTMEGLERQGIPLWGLAVQKTGTFFFAYFTAAAVGSSATSATKNTLGFLQGGVLGF